MRKQRIHASNDLPSYRGAKNVGFEWYNTQADPSLVYKGYRFNYYDIEDALWYNFMEDTGYTDDMAEDATVEAEFDRYVQDNIDDYLEDVLYGGYFDEGSKDWRDMYRR